MDDFKAHDMNKNLENPPEFIKSKAKISFQISLNQNQEASEYV